MYCVFLALASVVLWAQSDVGQTDPPQQIAMWTIDQQPDDSGQNVDQSVVQGLGQDSTQNSESNDQQYLSRSAPLLIGFGEPHVVPGAENRSFLIPGAQLSTGFYAGQPGGFGKSNLNGSARGLGSLSLQEIRRRYNLGVDYVGGIAYFGRRGPDHPWLQSLDADQHYLWRTGEFAVRDSFSYLPEGSFGIGSYGGVAPLNSLGLGFAGELLGLGIFGAGQFASLGELPRITNVALADVTQYLSPRSAFSVAGSYGLVHFTGNNQNLLDSHQFVGQGAYNHILDRKDQIAVIYANQELRFPSNIGDRIDTNLVNVLFGRHVRRIQLVAGGGPQFTHIEIPVFASNQFVTVNRTTMSGRATLAYRFQSTEVGFRFSRYNTNGSGFFAGATTDEFHLFAHRPLSRLWSGELDMGYSYNQAIAPLQNNQARTFTYLFVGGGVHRQLGREFSAFVSYQIGYATFDVPFCINSSNCGRTWHREIALIGVDWHPHPIRLD